MPNTPNTPLKSALKSPGAPPRTIVRPDTILSPTFYEEKELEKQESQTEKDQAKDLKIKTRVRVAKFILRGTSCGCSLIVLSMLAATFSIFNATKALPPRNELPPWSTGTPMWPQITVLVVAGISLALSLIILAAYFRGGHKRAEKVAVYYTVFAVTFFVFSIVMWGVGAAVLQQSKDNYDGNDIWGWSCKDNVRRELFSQDVSYNLVCRLQNWSLVCCIIEIIVEVFTITIYVIVFWRFYSKRRLRKSMARRDTARSDLYLSQIRSQSAPNTPGPKSPWSPSGGGYNPLFSPRYAGSQAPTTPGQPDPSLALSHSQQPFVLQPAPARTPKAAQNGFETQPTQAVPPVSPYGVAVPPPPMSPSYAVPQSPIVHMHAAPGEQEFEPVPIPGAYAAPMSPGSTTASPQYVTPMEGPNAATSGAQSQMESGQSQSQYAAYFGVAR